ncbi:LysR family transcriptional regulator [Pseudomonas syringae]|uniref:DNA-binding transcriptional regulator n=1 Tax=Pseudomonas syringae pv. actinidiae TaxID=103796 RepID=A0A2V0QC83_PSESF|nr:LysR family transcriptional regulator [Pseudomonas syringae]BBI43228.1 HTH-type transcriptional regulator GltC [Pseudomonas syringae pv. actinidiae]GBH07985.1 DNA-binding transcriptional regulator [Pseudomonas syringae pv. actinidiae]
MDLGRLRALRELSIRKTMTAVAEAMFVSPSAISQQISQLEAEFGVPLIERRGRGVALTPSGLRLVEHVNQVIEVLETAKTDIAEISQVVAGELRVCAFPSVAALLIPSAMRSMAERYPRLRLTLHEMEPSEGLNALKTWNADIALIDDLTITEDSLNDNIALIPLLTDRLCALLPPTHPMVGREAINVTDLRHEVLAMDTAQSVFSQVIRRACLEAGFEPSVNGYCDSYDVALAMVEAGCSVALLPGFRVKRYHGSAVVKWLHPEIKRSVFVAHRKGEERNPAIAEFVRDLQTAAAPMSLS